MKNDKILIIRIDELTKSQLETLAKKHKRSTSDYLRLLIDYAVRINKKF